MPRRKKIRLSDAQLKRLRQALQQGGGNVEVEFVSKSSKSGGAFFAPLLAAIAAPLAVKAGESLIGKLFGGAVALPGQAPSASFGQGLISLPGQSRGRGRPKKGAGAVMVDLL